jgi:transposase
MDAIFYRLRTGCQWKALDVTRMCSGSSAHRRFQEWTRAGVFRCLWAQGLLDYDEVRELGKEFGYPLHIRPRNEEAQALKRHVGFKARRWVVERTHSWMNRFRSVLIRWDKKVENYLGLLHLACAFITYRATGLLG